jgi:4-hydroxythreonine-4-phosphate dehydrogenase
MEAVARACDLCLGGGADGMVTAPIHKAAIHRAGYHFPGHTEFIAERAGGAEPLMLMVSGGLRVALVTTHVPLRAVADLVTPEAVLAKLRLLHAALREDFGIDRPRIALLGLNPHAGDEGVLGTEEQTVMGPALAAARAEGIDATGPHPADAFFGRRADRQHHGVLSPYHDQGLVAFKALAMGRGVNVTAGLPLVRTSPDHGTAFDIAGRGVADPASFIEAVRVAAEIVRARKGGGR